MEEFKKIIKEYKNEPLLLVGAKQYAQLKTVYSQFPDAMKKCVVGQVSDEDYIELGDYMPYIKNESLRFCIKTRDNKYYRILDDRYVARLPRKPHQPEWLKELFKDV